VPYAVSLEQLDAFLAYARSTPQLAEPLSRPLPLEDLLALAATAGFVVEEADVLAAQVRAEQTLSDAELQQRAGQEARRLRSFIQG
jgi:predicted ribosomally synthesized peptide with nif11-like leader